jgi:nucleoside-diphosphate-sugar epimerase
VVIREHAAHPVAGRTRVLVNLLLQAPNSLLHDGHAWWGDPAAVILSSTRRALREAERTHAGFVVHASYALLGDVSGSARVGRRLLAIADAARDAERIVLDSGRPACVVRLGYLYGPEMRDLQRYRRALRLGRPYWAGPRGNLQHHLHTIDAARALLQAAAARSKGAVTYATDGSPASFADFMDHFAHLVGRAHPLHLPRVSRLLVHPVVGELHQQMTDVGASGPARPELPGFTPGLADYRAGLEQVIEAWRRPA